MKEWFRKFMSGRYGSDQLSRFIMGCGLVTLVLYMIFRGSLWYYLTLFLLIWNYFRAFSRNHQKRYQENLKFLELRSRVIGIFKRNPTDKNHRIYRCPSCKQKVRVPRGRGRISITCPKCHTEFIRKS